MVRAPLLLAAAVVAASAEDEASLLQHQKKRHKSVARVKAQQNEEWFDFAKDIINCGMACANFASSSRETDCDSCVNNLIQEHEISLGANGVGLDYIRDMLQLKDSPSYADAFCDGTIAGCEEKDQYPGLSVKSVMGWENVHAMVARTPEMEWSGEWWRGNELGYIINNPLFWSGNGIEPPSISLGITPKQHAAIRPYMERSFTLGKPSSKKYKEAQVIVDNYVKQFLEDRRAVGSITFPDDMTALVHQILSKVGLDREVTFKQAQDFMAVQSKVVALGTISQLVPALVQQLSFFTNIRDQVAGYVDEFEAIVEAKWGEELAAEDCAPSKSCARQLASGTWDALYAAGGLSVPTNMHTGVGLLFSEDASNPFPERSYPKDRALNFFWENHRYFAPVVGFPHWETRPTCAGLTPEETAALASTNGGTEGCPAQESGDLNQYQGGKRVVPNLALAQRDPARWGKDAGEFKIRNHDEYIRNSVGFAEPAVNQNVADGKMNRVCPGKDLSLMIGTSFFEQFDKSQWHAPLEPIVFGAGPKWLNGFTLTTEPQEPPCDLWCRLTR